MTPAGLFHRFGAATPSVSEAKSFGYPSVFLRFYEVKQAILGQITEGLPKDDRTGSEGSWVDPSRRPPRPLTRCATRGTRPPSLDRSLRRRGSAAPGRARSRGSKPTAGSRLFRTPAACPPSATRPSAPAAPMGALQSPGRALKPFALFAATPQKPSLSGLFGLKTGVFRELPPYPLHSAPPLSRLPKTANKTLNSPPNSGF